MTAVLVAIIAVLVLTAAVDILADRVRVAAPILMLLIGACVSLIPNMPQIEVDPELVLMVILPPLLYSAAVNMPVSDFRRNLLPISVLAVVLVAVSSAVVGFAVNAVVPGIGIAACVALGAIVSPTDAVATSLVKEAGVSKRVVTILEGEGLINDATALVILSSAVGAMTSQISAGEVVLDFVIAVVGAVIVGWIVGRVMIWVRSKISKVTPDTVLSLATPFIAFLPAEHLHSSGLVAAVVAGLVASQRGPRVLTPTQRMSSKTTWNSLMLILELSVFLIMGLELTSIVEDLGAESYGWLLAVKVAVIALGLILVLRTTVVMPLLALLARRSEHRSEYRTRVETASKKVGAALELNDALPPNDTVVSRERVHKLRKRLTRLLSDLNYHSQHLLGAREGAVMVWAGMRGGITLAAAQTLPRETPHRSFLVFVAFLVAAASLLLPGSTLNLVVKLVKPAQAVKVNREEQDEIRKLMHAAARNVQPPMTIRDLLARTDGSADSSASKEPSRITAMTLARQQFEAMRNQPETDEIQKATQPTPLPKSEDISHDVSTSFADATSTTKQSFSNPRISADDRRRLAETSYDYALKLIAAQRTALLNANDAGLFGAEAVSEALDTLDADQLSLETRAVSLN